MKKRFHVTEEVDENEDEMGRSYCVLAVTETPDGWGFVISKEGGIGVRVSKRDLGKLRGMLDAATREQ